MKRMFTIFLALLMFTSLCPIYVIANESESSERDALIATACTIFPEYSSKIQNSSSTFSTSTYTMIHNEPIVSINRAVSENEIMTYTEYSNGVILLSDYVGQHSITYIDEVTNSIVTTHTINITATCTNVNGYLKLTNVKYAIIDGQYDSIISAGTATTSGNCALVNDSNNPTVNSSETSSSPAYVKYSITWRIGSQATQFLTANVILSVRNNVASVSHNLT